MGIGRASVDRTNCNANAVVDAHLKYYLRLMPQLRAWGPAGNHLKLAEMTTFKWMVLGQWISIRKNEKMTSTSYHTQKVIPERL